MAKTPLDVAIAAMNRQGRQAVGTGTYSTKLDSRKPSANTTTAKRKGAQSGSNLGPGGHRKGELYPGPAGKGDRDGAAFRVVGTMGSIESPEAHRTQSNTRFISSTINRSTPAFGQGSRSGY